MDVDRKMEYISQARDALRRLSELPTTSEAKRSIIRVIVGQLDLLED